MAQPELGIKRICGDCDAKFYDLNRNPAVCPKCSHTFTAKKASAAPAAKPAKETAKPAKEAVKPVSLIGDDESDADKDELDEAVLLAGDVDDEDIDTDDGLDEPAVKDVFIETDDDSEENVTDLIEGVGTKIEEN